jgi:hypothetical protein
LDGKDSAKGIKEKLPRWWLPKKLRMKPKQTITAAILAGALTVGATFSASALSTLTIDEFTGGDSSVKISISQATANSLNFLLQITKPTSPSLSDLTGFWGHIANESLLSGLTVSGVQFGYNGTFVSSTAFVFEKEANDVWVVGGNNNNLNGLAASYGEFDFGFRFGSSNGQDSPAINEVKFTFNNASGLNEGLFADEFFGARLQPLAANPSSAKLAGSRPPTTVPDGGSTVALVGLAIAGLGLVRRKLS